MSTILDQIVDARRLALAHKMSQAPLPRLDEPEIFARVTRERPGGPPRPLFKNLRAKYQTENAGSAVRGLETVPLLSQAPAILIAECKKASPSKGVMLEEYRPLDLALDYEAGGASAVSVLTEPEFFLGSDRDLMDVRSNIGLPVLRKDFLIDPWQVDESFVLGADLILLIAAVLDDQRLRRMAARARALGMEVLLEVKDGEELVRAAALRDEVDALGVNSRDLRDFSVDPSRLCALAQRMPEGPIPVAESGLSNPDDLRMLYRAGFRAFLVGEYFARSSNPKEAVRSFRSALDDEAFGGTSSGAKVVAQS